MATYNFETISATDALAYDKATDALIFSNPTSSGNKVSVIFTAATFTTPATTTVTDLVTGRVVGNGANFAQGNIGDDIITAATATGANTLLGGQDNDSITGSTFGDTISGDLGNDTLIGNGGNDSVFGQAGNDQITVGNGTNVIDG